MPSVNSVDIGQQSTQPSQPPLLVGERVDLKSFRYLRRYSGEMVRGLFRSHRPTLDKALQSAIYKVKVDESLVKSWESFVSKTEDSHHAAPLTYYNCAGAFGLFDLLKAMRINFGTILHLKAELKVPTPKPLVVGEDYSLRMSVVDIIPKDSKCILVFQSELSDAAGEVLRIHKDFWYVRKCPRKLMQNIAYPQEHSDAEFKGISYRESQFRDLDESVKKRSKIRVPNDAGQQFARISGDYNVIHTTHLGAKLCGKKKAFLQGFGVMNLCLHHISLLTKKPLTHFDISFSKSIYVGQEVELVLVGQGFELSDSDGNLLAFGNCH